MNPEEQYKKELAESGVELPELEVPKEDEKEVEKPAEVVPDATPTPEAPKADEKPEDVPDLTEPTEKPKRSIYDEYKEKKSELKTEKELREQAERERDELKLKLDAIETAKTPEQKKAATDDLEEFAKEIDADPETIRKMQQLFTRNLQVNGLTEEDRRILEEAKKITASNQLVVEKAQFDTEFNTTLPKIKELLPTFTNASAEEITAVKEKLDELSHTEEFHDKSLAYVVFENKDLLTKLISPKKRGMETKEKKDGDEVVTTFNPNADYSKMSPVEKEAWEAEYKKLGQSDGLVENTNGAKILI